MSERITIETIVRAPIARAWFAYTDPKHIMKWNHASDDWHCPHATNDLRVDGTFTSRMEAKDGSVGFDFTGTYTEVIPEERIAYRMEDGRMAEIEFMSEGDATRVRVTFDIEHENPPEMQREGWQNILNSYAREAEGGA